MDPVAAKLDDVDRTINRGHFKADWPSIISQYRIPAWYEDAKFGIFIHWGVYSVPAFGNEWYPRRMYEQGSAEYEHHLKTFGPHDRFGYKDFIPMFTAEQWAPDAWAELFRQSGARYVVPVAEHHDGFPLYDCSFTDWSSVKMGPKRDIMEELSEAVRGQGLRFGLSSHRAENYWFFSGGRKFPSDVQDDRYRGLYNDAIDIGDFHGDVSSHLPPPEHHSRDWLARTAELIDKYRPELIYFDWWIEHKALEPYLRKLTSFYYNRAAEWGSGVVIDYKLNAFPEGAAVFDVERGQLTEIRRPYWQTDTSVSRNSWGYVADQDYKSPTSIIHDLIDIVSKNGGLLLNIGPKPDGTIPEPEQAILREMGQWLAINGEAIYGSRPWEVFGEGPTQVHGGTFNDVKRDAFTPEDIRFTTRDGSIYAILLGWPESGHAMIRALADDALRAQTHVSSVRLLGHEAPLRWSLDSSGMIVELPQRRPCQHAYVLKLQR